MRPAIRIRNLSKRYELGGARNNSTSLRETLTNKIRNFCSPANFSKENQYSLWAVDDVSFDIERGEILGIIGKNGAGKSTLLKMLSRITKPTKGEIEVYGLLSSLLEVGTGFHPELTGRENIFLNGAVLGMSRHTINQRFDEIVQFAEVERFIDTPVKHYSSGMYVRLAFSVAAHLSPEILLLDEVLAVGDVSFQKKCLGKMGDVVRDGRTVVFVSHNMAAVRQLCPRSILIDSGKVAADGETLSVLREYNNRLKNRDINESASVRERESALPGNAKFTSFSMMGSDKNERYEYRTGETIRIQFRYEIKKEVPDLSFFFAFCTDLTGEYVTSIRQVISEKPLKIGATGLVVIELPDVLLMPNEYHPYAWLGNSLGQGYDRLNYQLNSCPPVYIVAPDHNPQELYGYFFTKWRVLSTETR